MRIEYNKMSDGYVAYMGKWDNLPADDDARQEGLELVLRGVEEHGELEVSFDYMGATRCLGAAQSMIEQLGRDDLEYTTGRYYFMIRQER